MLLEGKKGIVLGMANKNSIAWGIVQELKAQGAEIICTYLNESTKRRVSKLTESIGIDHICNYDCTDENSINETVDFVSKTFSKIDFIVHSIAFAEKENLQGRYIDINKDNFLKALEISCFSFVDICKKMEHLLNDNASILTMSYLGAVKYIDSYNIMGVCKAALESSVRYIAMDFSSRNIRVHGISAGPIKTLSAAVIKGIKSNLDHAKNMSFLKRNITLNDIGKCSVYLLSDLSSGTSGGIHYIDCGASEVHYTIF